MNRKQYMRKYNKDHYKELRAYKTLWKRSKGDEVRFIKLKKLVGEASQLLKGK